MSPADENGEHWLTPAEAARFAEVHPKTLRDWANRGQIRFRRRTPTSPREYSEAAIEAMMQPHDETGTHP